MKICHKNRKFHNVLFKIVMIFICFIIIVFVKSKLDTYNDEKIIKAQQELQGKSEKESENDQNEQQYNGELSVSELGDLQKFAEEKGIEMEYFCNEMYGMDVMDIKYSTNKGVVIEYFEDIYPTMKNVRSEPDFLQYSYLVIVNYEEYGERYFGLYSNVLSDTQKNSVWERICYILEDGRTDAEKVLQLFVASKDFIENQYKSKDLNNANTTIQESVNIYVPDNSLTDNGVEIKEGILVDKNNNIFLNGMWQVNLQTLKYYIDSNYTKEDIVNDLQLADFQYSISDGTDDFVLFNSIIGDIQGSTHYFESDILKHPSMDWYPKSYMSVEDAGAYFLELGAEKVNDYEYIYKNINIEISDYIRSGQVYNVYFKINE